MLISNFQTNFQKDRSRKSIFTKMFSSGPNYGKLKTNLRLAVNRLKLLGKKKTELALKARKEIADYIHDGKAERAKIRVEHIIVSFGLFRTVKTYKSH